MLSCLSSWTITFLSVLPYITKQASGIRCPSWRLPAGLAYPLLSTLPSSANLMNFLSPLETLSRVCFLPQPSPGAHPGPFMGPFMLGPLEGLLRGDPSAEAGAGSQGGHICGLVPSLPGPDPRLTYLLESGNFKAQRLPQPTRLLSNIY